MRTIALVALAAIASSAEARTVHVTLELATADCVHASACPTETLSGDGVVLTSIDSGRSTLFVELRSPRGPLAMIDISYGLGAPIIRYREVQNSQLIFSGTAETAEVSIPQADARWTSPGVFSFRVVSEGQVRIVESGFADVDRSGPDPIPPPHGGGGGEVVVVIGDPDPYYGDTSSGGCEGDTVDDPDYPDPDDSSDSSDDEWSDDSGGCEGDTTDDDGWDDGSDIDTGDTTADGCDDGTDSSSSSDGCEGDTVEANHRPNSKFAAARSTFRLLWPIGFVGIINRRLKARAAKTTPRP